jgi:hypothetical protein
MRSGWLVSVMCGGALGLAAGVVVAQDADTDGETQAEPSLARLLRPAALPSDELDQLERLLSELAERPAAAAGPVLAAVTQTRGELLTLRRLREQGAARELFERHKQLVWAALSWLDRLEASSQHAAAVSTLELRVRRARAEADAAHAARLSAEAALLAARGSAP